MKSRTITLPAIRPIGDRVLLRRLAAAETTKGGIVIPERAKEKPQECECVSVGDGRRTRSGDCVKLEVRAGDRVLVGKYSGHEIRHEGEEFLVIREDDVLAVLEA
jgi:chaperonin GroES